jgi:hypothetical protein
LTVPAIEPRKDCAQAAPGNTQRVHSDNRSMRAEVCDEPIVNPPVSKSVDAL